MLSPRPGAPLPRRGWCVPLEEMRNSIRQVGLVLALTDQTPDGPRRRYADASLVHTIGFHSARFGDTNLEARYDAELRGERNPSALDRVLSMLLHRDRRPPDLVLTVDRQGHDAA